jgi:predicted permease
VDLWTPLTFTPDQLATQRGANYLDVVGRLRPGVGLDRARADVGGIGARLAAAYPRNNAGTSVTAASLREAIAGDARPAMRVLLGAVTLVLALACANVANLLLARGVGRGRDLAIRTALGASPRRLARALMVESLVLALVGGAAGVLVAVWGAGAVAGLSAAGVPLLDQTQIDAPVLLYALVTSVVTGVLFGLLPAWQAARVPDLTHQLKTDGGATTADRERRRLRRVLVAAELALATTLLVGAGLLIRSLGHLVTTDLGIDTRGTLTFAVSLPDAAYPTPAERERFVATLTERFDGLPGVTAAGAVFGMPLTGFGYTISGFELDGRELSLEEKDRLAVSVRVVTPRLFDALGMDVLRGRAFTAADREGAPPVIVVNATAARMLWPTHEALGRRFTIGTRLGQGGERVGGEVVGVVADVRERGPAGTVRPTLFVPHAQKPVGFLGVALRTTGDPAGLAAPARRVLAELDPAMPMFRVRTLDELASAAVAQPRLYAVLLSLFAGTAVLLAVVGVYGVMSFNVARRTRDIGLRMALGATPGEVLRLVLHEGAAVTAAGVASGLLAALAVTRLLRRLLYGVDPADPLTLVAVAVLLGVVGLVACLLPARRATLVDPLVALRSE